MSLGKNYIILAHHQPNQLLRLVERLEDGHTRIYLHIDKQSDIRQFHAVTAKHYVKVITERFASSWGGIGIVKATVAGMRAIVRDNRPYHTKLLSGQCYPLVSNNTWNQFLQAHPHTDFIDVKAIDKAFPNWEQRMHQYKVDLSSQRNDHLLVTPVEKLSYRERLHLFKKLMRKALDRKKFSILGKLPAFYAVRKTPVVKQDFGGSQWWTLSYPTLKKVVGFLEAHPDFLQYHRYTLLPDEIVFQTVISHLRLEDPSITIKPNLTFTIWPEGMHTSPLVLHTAHLPSLMEQSGKLFARKMDETQSAGLLNTLDQLALGGRQMQ